ncbi:MAG: ECF transporter S component [Firmicutes bacterium]|nr:ECF transporter S component [Bacillota bacterium]
MEELTSKRAPRVNTVYVVFAAFFTALVFVVTLFASIPAGFLGANGNINLGDAIIFLASAVLGPAGGAIAGAVGATAANLAGGYMMYAPFTFVIKGAAGFVCGFICRKSNFIKNKHALRRIIAMALAAAVIVTGYFLAELVIISSGFATSDSALMVAALRTIPGNLLQVGISGVIAFIVLPKIYPVYFKTQASRTAAQSGGEDEALIEDGNEVLLNDEHKDEHNDG